MTSADQATVITVTERVRGRSAGRSRGRRRIFGYAALVLLALVSVLPLLWMVSTSFKTDDDVFSYPPKWIPEEFLWSNYTSLWRDLPMTRWILNTIVISVTVVAGQLFLCSTAAYAFARMRFRGRDSLFYLFLGSMMIPAQITLIPSFVLISKLGWLDTYKALIIPSLGTVFGIFMLRQFFLSIPGDIEDAARIDGAGHWRIYWTIVLPLAKPALLTFAIFSVIGVWGDFLWPLVVIDSPEKMPLTVGLNYLNSTYHTDWPRLMAGDVVSILPLMALYAVAQRYFVEGIATTGLKG